MIAYLHKKFCKIPMNTLWTISARLFVYAEALFDLKGVMRK